MPYTSHPELIASMVDAEMTEFSLDLSVSQQKPPGSWWCSDDLESPIIGNHQCVSLEPTTSREFPVSIGSIEAPQKDGGKEV